MILINCHNEWIEADKNTTCASYLNVFELRAFSDMCGNLLSVDV